MTRRRPEESPYVVWLDLETTGSDVNTEKIIEVGAAITDRHLNVLDTFSAVVWPFPDVRKGKKEFRESLLDEIIVPRAKPVVQKMHAANGLWDDMATDGIPLPTADTNLARWMDPYTDDGAHLPLAGSGVSHFDRRFIRAQLPVSERMFSYWHYDIGVVRRFMAWMAPKALSRPLTQANAKPSHRALDDVLGIIEQARIWRDSQWSARRVADAQR